MVVFDRRQTKKATAMNAWGQAGNTHKNEEKGQKRKNGRVISTQRVDPAPGRFHNRRRLLAQEAWPCDRRVCVAVDFTRLHFLLRFSFSRYVSFGSFSVRGSRVIPSVTSMKEIDCSLHLMQHRSAPNGQGPPTITPSDVLGSNAHIPLKCALSPIFRDSLPRH